MPYWEYELFMEECEDYVKEQKRKEEEEEKKANSKYKAPKIPNYKPPKY